MYRSLRADEIVRTVARLRDRVTERFPESGLSKVAAELLQVAEEARSRIASVRRPNLALRAVLALAFFGVLALLVYGVARLGVRLEAPDLAGFVQSLADALGIVAFLGAAVLTVTTLDQRLQRRHALQAVHELRSLAHIVDMHQLTKDPDRAVPRVPDTASSPERPLTPFELTRYLDYCSEMLSLISKLGALYVQNLYDPVVLAAVDQVEDLANGLSRKIWQKIMILERLAEPAE